MTESIFRQYDIRGIVETELTLKNMQDLTRAMLTYFLRQQSDLKEIVIGMDGRTHSSLLKKEIIKAATSWGIDVVDIGLCPTPAFYFSLFTTNTKSGFMITASHNPKEYNGIKICLDTQSVWGKQIQEIKRIYFEKDFIHLDGNKQGTVRTYDANSNYITWLTDHFSHLKNKTIDAIIDCGNATAGIIFPELIKAMGWKNVRMLYETVDGIFPNHEADPTKLENMLDVQKILLKDNSFKIGLGLDGDSDRMNPMTKKGILVPGDQLLALYSKAILQKHPGATIVFDIKSSTTLVEALEKMGAQPCIAPSGHSIIKDYLRKKNAKLAGELSCHFFFNDRYFGYDDGIYAALRLFELLDQSEKSLDELVQALPQKVSSPEYRITCAEKDKSAIVDSVKSVFAKRTDTQTLTIDGIRAQTPYGWGLVRASNTQSVVCLRFESDTPEGLQKISDDFISALSPFYSKKELETHFGK